MQFLLDKSVDLQPNVGGYRLSAYIAKVMVLPLKKGAMLAVPHRGALRPSVFSKVTALEWPPTNPPEKTPQYLPSLKTVAFSFGCLHSCPATASPQHLITDLSAPNEPRKWHRFEAA